MNTVGDRLLAERERLGLNQTQMGECGGVKKRAQIYYEDNERQPDTEYLIGIAAAGADINYIVTGIKVGAVTAPVLTQRENQLLENFRCADEQGRAIVEGAASVAAKHKSKVESGGKK